MSQSVIYHLDWALFGLDWWDEVNVLIQPEGIDKGEQGSFRVFIVLLLGITNVKEVDKAKSNFIQ